MKVKILHLFAACSLLGFNANAQLFQSSSTPDSIAGNSLNVSKTTNDTKSGFNVIAWDGSNPAIRYISPSGTIGFLSLPAGITSPDIVISNNPQSKAFWILIVYLQNGTPVLARYRWDIITSTFIYDSAVSFPDNAGTYCARSVNIDADVLGDYAIAVGQTNGAIRIYHGLVSALPGGLTLNATTNPSTGKDVDVCLNYNNDVAYGTVGATNIHFSFVDAANTKVLAKTILFNGNIFSTTATIAPAVAGTTYGNPVHIASAKYNDEVNDRYSIVYTQTTAATARIEQYNFYNGAANYNELTGGGVNHPQDLPISMHPVVTYCEGLVAAPATITAFKTTYSGHNLTGMKPKTNGNSFYGPLSYYTINYFAPSDCDYLALSSKYADYSMVANDVLISYYSTGNHNIYFKQVTSWTNSMRTIKNNSISAAREKNITVYPNPATDHIFITTENFAADDYVQVSITDITGRSSYYYTGEIQNLQAAADVWFAGIVPGVYYVKISGNDNYAQSLKLVKQ